jgi:UDP:flavonoid glycosyltransferase YjiC (YdhE family)
MSRVQQEASLVICHGGFGTVTAALLAGRPLLILPQQLEQTVLALRLQKLGMALVVPKEQQNPNWRKLCKSLLEDPRYATQAQALAAAHPDWSAAGVADAIADRCEELLRR